MVAGKAHTTRRRPWTYRPISYVSSEGIQALTPFTKLSIGRISTPSVGAYRRQRSPRRARGAWRPCSACSRRARSFTKKPLLIGSHSDVRFGSKADMCSAKGHVHYSLEADICGANTNVRFGQIADISPVIREPRYRGCESISILMTLTPP